MLILSQVWPSDTNGHGIALLSALRVLPHYAEGIDYWVLLDVPAPQGIEDQFPNVRFRWFRLGRARLAVRFLGSLRGNWPAICAQYLFGRSAGLLESALTEWSAAHSEMPVFCEHLPLCAAAWNAGLAKRHPVFVRAHDVLSDAFLPFTRSGFAALFWRYEVRRIKYLERTVLNTAHRFAAITSVDAARFSELYGRKVEHVVGVGFEWAEQPRLPITSAPAVVHLGGGDMRKLHGLRWFVADVWPLVRSQCPTAILYLGGDGAAAFDSPSAGVSGCNVVDSATEFMAKGQIFVNPQLAGSGIKLKSIMALGCERTLVSTSNGVSGMPVEAGIHCLVSDEAPVMADLIARCLRDGDFARRLACAGAELVRREYTLGIVRGQLKAFLREDGAVEPS